MFPWRHIATLLCCAPATAGLQIVVQQCQGVRSERSIRKVHSMVRALTLLLIGMMVTMGILQVAGCLLHIAFYVLLLKLRCNCVICM